MDPDCYPLGVADPFCNAGMMPDLNEIISRDKVKWAISSIQVFKSPGPDGISPALLQHAGYILHEYLMDVYRDGGVMYLTIGKMCLWFLYQRLVNPVTSPLRIILSFESFGETYRSVFEVKHRPVSVG